MIVDAASTAKGLRLPLRDAKYLEYTVHYDDDGYARTYLIPETAREEYLFASPSSPTSSP